MRTTITRCLVAAFSLLACAAAAELGGPKAPTPRQPNIVLINCDDLDFDESELWDFYDYHKYPSFTGAKMLGYTSDWQEGAGYKLPMLTPNISSLAKEGCVFERFYMTSSLCTPSRYSLMTGQYASRSPVLEKHFGKTNPAGFQMEGDLAPNQWIFPKALKQAGYATGLVGKWHLVESGSPERGFIVPSLENADARDPAVAARVNEVYQNGLDYIKRNYGFDYVGAVYQHNANGLGVPKELIKSEHHLEWQTFHAKKFIDQHHDQPFFLYYAPTLPHGWYGGSDDLADPMDMDIQATLAGYSTEHIGSQPSREDVRRRLRQAKIDKRNGDATWLDDSVGEVLAKLKEFGLEQDTLVIFTSDQLSRGKFSVTEGCHVPFVVRWPGTIPAGSRCGQLVANIDMATTLLGLAGTRPPAGEVLDGLDMSPVFRGQSQWSLDRNVLLEIGYMRGVVSMDNWKYCALRLPAGSLPKRDVATWREARALLAKKGQTPPPADAPLTPEEIAVMSYDGRIYYDRFSGKATRAQGPHRTFPHYAEVDQLFDLNTDPYEQDNLFGKPADKAQTQKLKQILREELAKLPRQFGEFHP